MNIFKGVREGVGYVAPAAGASAGVIAGIKVLEYKLQSAHWQDTAFKLLSDTSRNQELFVDAGIFFALVGIGANLGSMIRNWTTGRGPR